MTAIALQSQLQAFEEAKRSLSGDLDPRVRSWTFEMMMSALKSAVGWDTIAGRRDAVRSFARHRLKLSGDRYKEVQAWIAGVSEMSVSDVVTVLRGLDSVLKTARRQNEGADAEREKLERAKRLSASVIDDEMKTWDVARTKKEFESQISARTSTDKRHPVKFFVNEVMGLEGDWKHRAFKGWIAGRNPLTVEELSHVLRVLGGLRGQKVAQVSAQAGSPAAATASQEDLRRPLINFGITQMSQLGDMFASAGVGTAINEGDRIEFRRIMSNLCSACGIEAVFPEDSSQFSPVPPGDLTRISLQNVSSTSKRKRL